MMCSIDLGLGFGGRLHAAKGTGTLNCVAAKDNIAMCNAWLDPLLWRSVTGEVLAKHQQPQ